MKRQAAVFLTAAMVLGSSVTSFGASFSDINNVPWEGAKEYINKVADLGLMVGDSDVKTGKKVFRAKDKVTYCETTQMAYAILKNTNNLKSTSGLVTKWSSVLNGYNIPSWAHEAVAYALENNILSMSDVSKFMKDKNTNNYATREGVAVIFGKTLSAMNTVNTNASLSFRDKSSVASTSVPYVELLARLNILVGDNNNNFNPKNYINRAEMAVVASKTYGSLDKGGTTTVNPPVVNGTSARGTVTKVEAYGSSALVSILYNGKNVGFFGDSNTKIEDSTDTRKSFLDLSLGDVITVEYDGATVKKVTVHSVSSTSGSSLKTISGRIDDIYNDEIYINKSSGGMERYYMASNVEVTLNGEKSSVKSLMEANKDTAVDVEASIDISGKVSKIVAKTTMADGIKGTIRTLDSGEVYVKKESGGSTYYKIKSGATIKLDDKDSTISKINTAMKEEDDIWVILYRDSDGKVNKLFAYRDEPEDSDVEGTIRDLDSDEITVKKSNGSTSKHDIYSTTTFKLENKSSTVSEIKKAMEDDTIYVTLRFNQSGKLLEVLATTEKPSTSTKTLKGTIKDLDSSEIEVKKSSGGTETFDVTSSTKYYLEGKSKSRSDIEDEMDDHTLSVTVTYDSKNRATKVEASKDDDDLTGEITRFNEDEVRIKTSNGSKTYEWASSPDYYYDDDSIKFSKLESKVEDETIYGKLKLNSSGKVTRIDTSKKEFGSSSSKSSKTIKGKLRDVYDDYINVRDEDDHLHKIYYASTCKIYRDGSTISKSNLENTRDRYSNVYITVETNSSGKATKITISLDEDGGSNSTIRCDVKYIYQDSVIYEKSDGNTGMHEIPSSADIYYNGASYSSLKRVDEKLGSNYKNVKAVIYLDAYQKVKKIEFTD